MQLSTHTFRYSVVVYKYWEGLGAGGERDDRGWDGWMASLTQWTWVWVNPRSFWWIGRPGVLRFMGSQEVGHDWPTELNWIVIHNELIRISWRFCFQHAHVKVQSCLHKVRLSSVETSVCMSWKAPWAIQMQSLGKKIQYRGLISASLRNLGFKRRC